MTKNTRKWILMVILGVGLVGRLVGQEPTGGEESKKAATLSERVDEGMLHVLRMRSIGPALMSGRIADMAMDPEHPNVWYVAVGSGGLWKSTNAGTTFAPIFDHQGSYSIGCVALDPNASDTVWVGTGENVAGRHVGYGDGVYRSRDGGRSFEHLGLKHSEHISKIVIDPRDSETVFVAAQGPLWSAGGERGLYKTTDGGKTWRNVLSKGPYTGVTDVILDPAEPDTLYAATHQRHRTVWALLDTGPESGIYKSVDGGETWRELTQGLPGGDRGKIGLGISAQDAKVVYATMELPNRKGGFYRSENGGESWEQRSPFVSGGTGPHYYQEIYVDPHRFDVIYHANDTLMRSVNGGRSFEPIEGGTKHVDNHVVVFHPTERDTLVVGCDGGIYQSDDFGKTYRFFANLPVTQFYKVDVDNDLPFYHVVGGTQDNNTQYGPTATRYVQGITNADWSITIGGDGHDNAIDPTDPNIVYCESQQGFLARYDRKTGRSVDIRPQPGAGEEDFRFNWDSPILISPHQSTRLYFGSRKLHRSEDRGESWTTISPDLSRQMDRWKLPIMGRVWGIDAGFDLYAMSAYGNITSISESPKVAGLLYVGTDDGLIQVSEDGGANWRRVERIFDVPEGAFVNDIKADRHDPDTVYACLDHHKTGDFKPYLVKSTDRGRSWKLIVKDLPERALVWRLEQDGKEGRLLFLGTEFGLYVSLDGGEGWKKLSHGMPNIPVRDIAIQHREGDLVCATFGRGFYVLDDYAMLRELSTEVLDREGYLFASRRSWWYQPADRLGGVKGFQGDSFYTAENPTYGAVFTVYCREAIGSKVEKRKEAEGKARGESGDVPVASLEELVEERREKLPYRTLEIVDAKGGWVTRLEVPSGKGMHRLSWDYRMPPWMNAGGRPSAMPGTYQATLVEWSGKEMRKLSEPVSFVVERMMEPTLPATGVEAYRQFEQAMAGEQVKLDRMRRRLAKIRGTLSESKGIVKGNVVEVKGWMSEIGEMEVEADRLEVMLQGEPLAEQRAIGQVPSPASRLGNLMYGVMSSDQVITQTHRQQLEIVRTELSGLEPKVQGLWRERVKPLRERLEQLGYVFSSDVE